MNETVEPERAARRSARRPQADAQGAAKGGEYGSIEMKLNIDLNEFALSLAGARGRERLSIHRAELSAPSEVLISAAKHARLVSDLSAVSLAPVLLVDPDENKLQANT